MRNLSSSVRSRRVGGAAVTLLLLGASAPVAAATPPVYAAQHPLQATSSPYAGYLNHAHAQPAFRWGWFGAEPFCDPARWHRGYHGDLMRWKTHRGY